MIKRLLYKMWRVTGIDSLFWETLEGGEGAEGGVEVIFRF